jgi:NAD(P)-dependent dehydrogenase (short-subunit alcohol dehydrogenase family)
MAERIAVVTGAGSGIGRAVAVELARLDYLVVLSGRRSERLATTAEHVARAGGDSLVVAADVTDPASVERLFAATMTSTGRLDLLVNNAGVSAPAIPLEELPVGEWRAVIDTNLTGAFLCTRQAVRIMKGQQPKGGRIINNGSVSASVPRPHAAAYTASKHGLTGLTKATALEGRAHHIACGQIDIGNAATELTADISGGALQADGVVRSEPTIDVHDVARAVGYMASLPPEANVLSLTIMATTMPFVGRG